MLPQTGEESTMAYTAVGMMLMALGSAGIHVLPPQTIASALDRST
ncbi:LPXTG cell wall anchor domain-containing protein [Paenibacillus amylolyticus]|nr:LPXTG cell wall anchor domain-containing protein [Paenibacillus amylolyticus]